MKIRVYSPEHSEEVQTILFALGFKWYPYNRILSPTSIITLSTKWLFVVNGNIKWTDVITTEIENLEEFEIKDGKLVLKVFPSQKELLQSLEDTDLYRFYKLYESVGIELEIKLTEQKNTPFEFEEDAKYYFLLSTTENIKFDGYSGFFSAIYFTSEGKFYGQGFWE